VKIVAQKKGNKSVKINQKTKTPKKIVAKKAKGKKAPVKLAKKSKKAQKKAKKVTPKKTVAKKHLTENKKKAKLAKKKLEKIQTNLKFNRAVKIVTGKKGKKIQKMNEKEAYALFQKIRSQRIIEKRLALNKKPLKNSPKKSEIKKLFLRINKNRRNKLILVRIFVKREKAIFKNTQEKIKFSKAIVNSRQKIIKQIIKILPIDAVKQLIKYINKKTSERKIKGNKFALSLMPEGTINPGVENKHKNINKRQIHSRKKIIKLPSYHDTPKDAPTGPAPVSPGEMSQTYYPGTFNMAHGGPPMRVGRGSFLETSSKLRKIKKTKKDVDYYYGGRNQEVYYKHADKPQFMWQPIGSEVIFNKTFKKWQVCSFTAGGNGMCGVMQHPHFDGTENSSYFHKKVDEC